MLAAINYHYIREDFNTPFPSIFGKTPVEFEKQLTLLTTLGTFVSQQQIIDAITNGNKLPERAMIITFDDGLKEQYELALPILQRMGIPAIFFINSANLVENNIQYVHKLHILRSQVAPARIMSFLNEKLKLKEQLLNVEEKHKADKHYKYDSPENAELKYFINFKLVSAKSQKLMSQLFEEEIGNEEDLKETLYMNKEEVKKIADLGMLGSHSHHHYPIGELSKEERYEEIKLSSEILKSICNESFRSFSYPYGSKSSAANSEGILNNHGVLFGFTMERAINPNLKNPLHLARLDNNDVPMGKAYRFSDINFFDYHPNRSWYNEYSY